MHGIMEVFCFEVGLVVGEGGGLAFEAGKVEAVVKERLQDGVGFGEGDYGMRIEVVLGIEVIKDEFVVVVEGELQVVAGGAFDGDGGGGKADGEMFPLLLPGEVVDEVEGFLAGALLGVGEFAGFEVF